MRVLLVGDSASRHIERLSEALIDAGVHVSIASFDGQPIPRARHVRLGTLPVDADRRYPLGIPRLARAIIRERPDVLHAHYLSSYGVMAASAHRLVSRRHRPPLIQTVWGSDILVTAQTRYRDLLARIALRGAAAVTGDSDELRDEVSRRAPSVPWHTFIFGPTRALLAASERPRRPVIVSHRRLVPEMRIELIIEAFRTAQGTNRTLTGHQLIVAGDGPLESELRRTVDSRVQLVGNLGIGDLHALLLQSEAFISVPRTDGTSASLLEGMAAGAIPIVNDIPANRQWVKPAVGKVVPRDPTANEIALAIVSAVQRPPKREAVRAAVMTTCWEDQVDSLISFYQKLSAERVRE